MNGRMTVDRVSYTGNGLWTAVLGIEGVNACEVRARESEDAARRDAQAIADRWNAYENARAVLDQLDAEDPVAASILRSALNNG